MTENNRFRVPTREEVIGYLQRQGYPEPDKDWVDEFMFSVDKNRRSQFWEAVANNYDYCDFDRWQHFQNVINTECSWNCFLTCSNALWEEEIEILELGNSKYTDTDIKRHEISIYVIGSSSPLLDIEVFSKEKPDFEWLVNCLHNYYVENYIDTPKEKLMGLIDLIDEIDIDTNDLEGEYCDSDSMDPDAVSKVREAIKEKFDVKEESKNFIFEDELYGCQDEHCECVDGYLWATEYLVDSMKSVISRTPAEMNTLDNINFYAYYNVKDSSLEVNGTYYYFNSINGKETQGSFILPLTKEEKSEIITEMENYCHTRYKCSCLEFVNEGREEVGKPLIDKKPVRSSLFSQIKNAEQRKTVLSSEDKNILADKSL